MAKRQIRDERGGIWDIWDVLPKDALGGAYDRRSGDRPRVESSPSKPLVQPELEGGWLCFQKNAERRRLAPIPNDWCDLPDGMLRMLLDSATPVFTPPDSQAPIAAAEVADLGERDPLDSANDDRAAAKERRDSKLNGLTG
jgi:hypothetical protein